MGGSFQQLFFLKNILYSNYRNIHYLLHSVYKISPLKNTLTKYILSNIFHGYCYRRLNNTSPSHFVSRFLKVKSGYNSFIEPDHGSAMTDTFSL